jgi:hypothetical protein
VRNDEDSQRQARAGGCIPDIDAQRKPHGGLNGEENERELREP